MWKLTGSNLVNGDLTALHKANVGVERSQVTIGANPSTPILLKLYPGHPING